MSARGFALGMNQPSKLHAEHGTMVRIGSGYVRPTQHKVPQDRILHTGDAAPVDGEGAAMISAYQPTLLELYRQDPAAVREQITRRAHRARDHEIRAFFARFFC